MCTLAGKVADKAMQSGVKPLGIAVAEKASPLGIAISKGKPSDIKGAVRNVNGLVDTPYEKLKGEMRK